MVWRESVYFACCVCGRGVWDPWFSSLNFSFILERLWHHLLRVMPKTFSSMMFLKLFVDVADTALSGRSFQLEITRFVIKLYRHEPFLLISRTNRLLCCLLRLIVEDLAKLIPLSKLISSWQLTNLFICIKSPLRRLYSKLIKFSSFRRTSYGLDLIGLTNFVAL